MKTLELNQMEKVQGGEVADTCGFAIAMGVIVLGAGIATGGLGLLFGGWGALSMMEAGC